jgi:hypothetical protein
VLFRVLVLTGLLGCGAAGQDDDGDAGPAGGDAAGVQVPCAPTNVQLLSNQDLDSGRTMWLEMPEAPKDRLIMTTLEIRGHGPRLTAHSPDYAAWLGGVNPAVERLVQAITLPPGASGLRLKGHILIASQDTPFYAIDKLYLEVVDVGGVVIEAIGGAPTFSNVDLTLSWAPFDFPIEGSYGGQTIRIQIRAINDELFNTNFFLDSLRLEATMCQ